VFNGSDDESILLIAFGLHKGSVRSCQGVSNWQILWRPSFPACCALTGEVSNCADTAAASTPAGCSTTSSNHQIFEPILYGGQKARLAWDTREQSICTKYIDIIIVYIIGVFGWK
jgi:hypothetical protein